MKTFEEVLATVEVKPITYTEGSFQKRYEYTVYSAKDAEGNFCINCFSSEDALEDYKKQWKFSTWRGFAWGVPCEVREYANKFVATFADGQSCEVDKEYLTKIEDGEDEESWWEMWNDGVVLGFTM